LGGVRRGYLPLIFASTAVSGIFLLVAFLGVVDFSGASDFAYNPLLFSNVSRDTNPVAAADSIRLSNALVPFHTWLPDARRSLYPGFSFIGGCYSS